MGWVMAVTLRQLLAAVEKARQEADAANLDRVVKLNLGNARHVAAAQCGEYGDVTDLTHFELSVAGRSSPVLLIFG